MTSAETFFGLVFTLGRATHLAGQNDDDCEGSGFCEEDVRWPGLSKATLTDLRAWMEARDP